MRKMKWRLRDAKVRQGWCRLGLLWQTGSGPNGAASQQRAAGVWEQLYSVVARRCDEQSAQPQALREKRRPGTSESSDRGRRHPWNGRIDRVAGRQARVTNMGFKDPAKSSKPSQESAFNNSLSIINSLSDASGK